ncbi:hypothetical protein SAMN06265795_107124 [Noviherbaspirillum humi]|uniref:Uncharacterized protein n=1 Tax=Noviherbaspirillum humi TaxID=1688639 RepID=A0A239HR19_9BURK|nr:hypothetical protein [Noviherbaspirillum humi]SNS83762.1 hypothetical protein SAMN06265795_107124 [Noviherbaspirillum humi]
MPNPENHVSPGMFEFLRLFNQLAPEDQIAISRVVSVLANFQPDEALTMEELQALFELAKRMQ